MSPPMKVAKDGR